MPNKAVKKKPKPTPPKPKSKPTPARKPTTPARKPTKTRGKGLHRNKGGRPKKVSITVGKPEPVTANTPSTTLTPVTFPSTVEIFQGKGKRLRSAPDEELVIFICHLIVEGADRDDAAISLGVPRFEWLTWWNQGEQDIASGVGSIFAGLVLAVQTAEAQDWVENARLIKGGARNADNLKWLLQAKNPRKWGQKNTVLHGGADAPPILTRVDVETHRTVSIEEAPALLTILEMIGALNYLPPGGGKPQIVDVDTDKVPNNGTSG